MQLAAETARRERAERELAVLAAIVRNDLVSVSIGLDEEPHWWCSSCGVQADQEHAIEHRNNCEAVIALLGAAVIGAQG